MSHLFKTLTVITVIFLSCIVPLSPAFACVDINRDLVQQILDDHRKKNKIPALEVSIFCPNEGVMVNVYSGEKELETQIPIDESSLFLVGSLTKSFVSARLLQLTDEMKVELDDKISKHLKGLPKAWKAITIRQLLNNTSGIKSYSDLDSFWQVEIRSNFKKKWSSQQLIDLVKDEPLKFSPGKGFYYSNTNFVLGGMIIEAITKKTAEENFKQSLFLPLNLQHTYLKTESYPNSLKKKLTHGYYINGSQPLRDTYNDNISWLSTAAGLTSNASDISLWLNALVAKQQLLSEQADKNLKQLVSTTNGKPMSEPNEQLGYGLGIMGVNDPYLGEIWTHAGSGIGFASQAYYFKDKNTIISSSMSRRDNGQRINLKLINTITDALFGKTISVKTKLSE